MNEPEKIDPRELSPLALAFVGDSVLELLVRQRLVEHHRLSAGKLNAEKVKYVSARAQFREEQLLEPLFTEDELAVFKRGRNASKASVAKHDFDKAKQKCTAAGLSGERKGSKSYEHEYRSRAACRSACRHGCKRRGRLSDPCE